MFKFISQLTLKKKKNKPNGNKESNDNVEYKADSNNELEDGLNYDIKETNHLHESGKKEKKKKKRESDDNIDEEEDVRDKTILYARCYEDLPEELKKKVRKAKLEADQMNEHFEVLCNVLRFTTKRHVVRDFGEAEPKKEEKEKEEKEKHDNSESNLPSHMRKESESSILYTNPKKIFKKAEFRGKGGFGRVYYAKTSSGKVAIKKMPNKSTKEKRMNLDEIAVLHFCNHPNIVQYVKTYIFEDEVSVIMEYMEGGSLSEAVKKFAFNEDHISYIAREMLKGIQYLHRNNLVHRDLKSGNVMLTTRGELKLIDFGLTVEISKCRVHMVGIPFWMPPEMIQCKPHGYPADIWSFAICLIEMADKKPPNRKARIRAMFVSATEGLKPYVDEQTHYSEQFKDLLHRCLELDPAKRATPEDLLSHPFIVQASTQKVMEDILRQIFLSRAFENSGMFI